jgi:hypothetical protein
MMINPDNRYADLDPALLDPRRRRLLNDLEATFQVALPPDTRAVIATALDQHAQSLGPRPDSPLFAHSDRRLTQPHVSGIRHTHIVGRGRLVSLIAVMALVLSTLVGYLHLQEPSPVSAAAMLRHALTTRPAASPSQVIHETSTLYLNSPFDLPDQRLFTPPMTLTVDQWTQLTASGAIAQQVTIMTSSSGALIARGLQIGSSEQIYGTLQNAVTSQSVPSDHSYAWLANPLNITNVPALLTAAQTSSSDRLRLLPQQSIGGVLTDPVEIRQSADAATSFPHPISPATADQQVTTMYIDPTTYAIRGVDVSSVESTGVEHLLYSLHVSEIAIVPLDDLPVDTFTLDAPSTAHYLLALPSTPVDTATPPTPPVPHLLLASPPRGMHPGELSKDVSKDAGSVYAVTSITYCSLVNCHGLPPGATQFAISFAQTWPASTSLPPLLATGQLMTLAVAGQTVQGYYLEEGESLGARRLIYQDGPTIIELYSQGLSKNEFFAAVGFLVKAQAHPELIPAKWRALGLFG